MIIVVRVFCRNAVMSASLRASPARPWAYLAAGRLAQAAPQAAMRKEGSTPGLRERVLGFQIAVCAPQGIWLALAVSCPLNFL